MADKRTLSIAQLRKLGRVGDAASSAVQAGLRPVRNLGFPYRRPTRPRGVVVPPEPSKLGADFDTTWARRPPARVARRVINRGPLQAVVRAIAHPEIVGTDRLADLKDLEPVQSVIFAPNHHSHVDTPLIITAVPDPWRSKLVVAAAADYFFDKRVKGMVAALTLNAFPIEREVTTRKSADELRRLIDTGWSVVIYPEGGRSPDGWGQEFKGGAAYLAARTGVPVVPVFIDGTGAIFGKGMKRPKPGQTKVVFGAPLWPEEGESTRRFNARIETAVTTLGDEALTDYWTARRRAAAGASPKLTGPEYSGWRRQWALAEQRKLGKAGQRRRQLRRWPDLG
ncbi:MAG TPA: lysophospholipid acyltransferase family protein [Ilumatobacteraceae bacterium]|nr:lysophospholipid acyltransferase family protein [Ilumatobacteraceae bacterium]HUC31952.1 lysophospholipid acyltransferase family protein [Ilumatobacteraceae bacterium]